MAVLRHKLAWAGRARLWRTPFPETIAGRMLARMEPGAWYGRGDLVNLVGEGRSSRPIVNRMLSRGWLERVANPAWQGTTNPQRVMAEGGAEPRCGGPPGAAQPLALHVGGDRAALPPPKSRAAIRFA